MIVTMVGSTEVERGSNNCIDGLSRGLKRCVVGLTITRTISNSI